jgi:hypothetical protein
MNTINLITFEEKHGSISYAYTTPEGLHEICLEIFTRRNKENWYWTGQDDTEQAEWFRNALAGDSFAACRYIDSHADWEYEGFSTQHNVKVYE